MTERFPVYRLTRDAYNHLDRIAYTTPEVYLRQDTDFDRILRAAGFQEYTEDTGITTSVPISLSPVDDAPPNLADEQALDFYRSFDSLTPRVANDERMWAWVNHFRLHAYSLRRWRLHTNANLYNYIRSHWFTSSTQGAIWQSWQSNTAARTWWIAHTAVKASRGSGGAFTAQEALDLFASAASYYHTLLRYNFTRHPMVLGEVVRAFLREGPGMKVQDGAFSLLGALNLQGGTQMLELLPRDVLRRCITAEMERVMSDPVLVADRAALRNKTVIRSLSLGAGVQSTVLALLAERGEYGLPKPDVAIFADTGWEPKNVYEHLDWLQSQLSFEIIRVQAGNIRDNILAGTNAENGRSYLGFPAFLVGTDGSKSVARRQCTANYKVYPINRKLREMLGAKPGERVAKDKHVEIWMGISADEVYRQKPSREEWATNLFPLVELGFSRKQLHDWFQENYPNRYLPRSACIGCPYKSDGEWKWLKSNSPSEFAEAVEIDVALRENSLVRNAITKNGAQAFLHRSRTPLELVNFSDSQDYDDFMNDDCEGLCGI